MTSLIKYSVLLAFLAAAMAGCEAKKIDAWFVGEMTQLSSSAPRNDDWGVYDSLNNNIKLFAAGNETLSFQLVIDADELPLQDLTIRCSDLKTAFGDKIAADNFSVYKMLPVEIEKFPSWYLRLTDKPLQKAQVYDVLVPIALGVDNSFTVSANQRLALWFDVYVPRSAKAGDYSGKIDIAALGRQNFSAKISAEVYDFVLPDSRPIVALGGFGHRELFRELIQRDSKPFVPVRLDRTNPKVREGLILLRQMMKLAHRHRLDLFDKDIHPILKRDRQGKPVLGWEDYDQIITPYLDGTAFEDRIGAPAWPLPISEDWPKPRTYGGINSKRYTQTLEQITDDCVKHFSQLKDVSPTRQLFAWPYRGKIDNSGYARHSRLAGIIRKTAPEIQILTTLPAEAAKIWNLNPPKNFKNSADIHVLQGQWLNTAAVKIGSSQEWPFEGTWISPGKMPYLPSITTLSRPPDIRAIVWFAMKYRCNGIFLAEVLGWDGGNQTDANSAASLFYSGKIAGMQMVLPSVRLKRLRRGLQDANYLWLLQLRQREAIADSLLNALIRYGGLDAAGDNYHDARFDGWVKDPYAWEMARRILAEEVLAAVHPSENSKSRLVAQRVIWKQFNERTRSIRIEQIRTNVSRFKQRDPKAEEMLAVISLDLFNEYSHSTKLTARITSMPDGWKPLVDQSFIEDFPAGRKRILKLFIRGKNFESNSNAKMPVSIEVTTKHNLRKEFKVEVPLLQTSIVKNRPKIDGILDDWPMRPGNTAADFKLLGVRGTKDNGLAERQTKVFVTNDDKNLYFAFRCDEPNLSGIVARPTNIIQYDQLLACGEDLVEIVFNPGLKAKDASGLYHMVIKPNGVVLTERGIASNPPLGQVRVWPGSASIAIGRQGPCWIIELCVPLSAFGEASRERFWGINFARFSQQGLEPSNWAGAQRFYYSPDNLGTMLLNLPEK